MLLHRRKANIIVDGDFNTTLKDFETLHPTDVKSISTPWGTGKTGNIDNGFVATVRPGSSYGKPTLEVRNQLNRRGLEFRYELKENLWIKMIFICSWRGMKSILSGIRKI